MSLATQDLWRPELAHQALTAPSVAPLRLPGWNCEPFELQTRGITWLFATPRAYLGDVTGTGKTIHGVGLAAAILTGEAKGRRLIFTCPNPGQWMEEFGRFLPGARAVCTKGLVRQQRRALYNLEWDILVTTYRLMWADADMLAALDPWLVWFDEASAFRTHGTETAKGARKIAAGAARVVCADATPIQNSLFDIHAQLEVMGLAGWSGSPFGTEYEFKARYIIEQPEIIRVKGGRTRTRTRVVGYRNLEEFRALFSRYYLRRTDGSGDMPSVVPEDLYVELSAAQLAAYRQVALSRDSDVRNQLLALQQICANTATYRADLGDHSAKLDWIMEALKTRLVDDAGRPAKVLVFTRFLATSEALARRLTMAGIGYGFIDGPHAASRDDVRKRFWEDPHMRVVIGTQAMERGLNLQIAKYVITVDLLFNPSRMEQILGRIKRSGSPHQNVFMLRLISPGTIEEIVLKILQAKQHLANRVNGDVSELFPHLDEEDRARLFQVS